jgi:hypothetical protein
MGAPAGEVPSALSARACYERILAWHRTAGEQEARKRIQTQKYLATYLRVLAALPPINSASEEDLDFLFVEVLTSTFEWSYSDEDSYGIKIANYARHAVDSRYASGLEQAREVAQGSALNSLKT